MKPYLSIIFTVLLMGCSLRYESHTGTVLDKVYTPASLGVGTTVTTVNGKSGVGMVTMSTPEKWIVVVQVGDETIPIETGPTGWALAQKGQPVEVVFGLGKHTGWRWVVGLK